MSLSQPPFRDTVPLIPKIGKEKNPGIFAGMLKTVEWNPDSEFSLLALIKISFRQKLFRKCTTLLKTLLYSCTTILRPHPEAENKIVFKRFLRVHPAETSQFHAPSLKSVKEKNRNN
jgi:hypothetical protein